MALPTTAPPPILTVREMTAPSFKPDSPPLWSHVSFDVLKDALLVVRGPSGCGKSVLLKCVAQLLLYPEGEVKLGGKKPEELGIPTFRSRVLYLPQRPAILPGTPNEFFDTLCGYKSRTGHRLKRGETNINPIEIGEKWGVDSSKWDQTWGTISGGEAQRIALSIALSLEPDVLLLDGKRGRGPRFVFRAHTASFPSFLEPTSALDARATELVEQSILEGIGGRRQTCVWITHSDEQAERLKTQVFDLTTYMPKHPSASNGGHGGDGEHVENGEGARGADA